MPNRKGTEQVRGPSGAGRTVSPATSRSETSSTAGSQAASPSDQARTQIDFQFLNFTHPSEAREAGARRKVRSHVTKQQHQREQQAAAQNRRSKSYQHNSTEQDLPAQRPHASTFPAQRPTMLEMPQQQPLETPASNTTTEPSSSASPSPVHSPTHLKQLDLADVYPEDWLPYLNQIIEHYLATRAIDITDVPDPEARILLRTRFWPFVRSDAAPLHAVLLAAATHYTNTFGRRSHPIDLLQLRGMAIRAINDALGDPDPARTPSDQLITAVAKMASYEALYGDKQVFHTHMTGLTRMVTLRGGLPALGLGGLLERILLWIDSNASFIAGHHVYFDRKAFPSRAVHPRPDPGRFQGGLGAREGSG